MATADGSRNPKAGVRKEAALTMLITGMTQLEWVGATLHEILGARSKPPRCVRPVLTEMQGF